MELKYYINTTQISEPIGFDDFKTVLKRTEQHGISAESSVGSLEFYGDAFDIIKLAYATDIDTELIFKFEKGTEIEQWIIDLSTYKETYNDYCSCTVKVGEIGVKTTFNNRVETKIDVTDSMVADIDGNELTPFNASSFMVMPVKKIYYTNSAKSTGTGYNQSWVNGMTTFVGYPMGVELITEHEGFNGSDSWGAANFFLNESGANETFLVKANLVFSISNTNEFSVPGVVDFISEVKLIFEHNNSGSFVPFKTYDVTSQADPLSHVSTFEQIIDFSLLLNSTCIIRCYLQAKYKNHSAGLRINFLNEPKEIRILKENQSNATTAQPFLIHELLNKITQYISGLTVKSDLYGRFNSQINPLSTDTVGAGAMKSIIKGYDLRYRGVPKINISFKDLIKNLNCIDNIGWGFFVEDEELFIRVENWKWFYKSDVLLTITNPVNKHRVLESDKVYSRIKTGYNKTITVDEINAVDGFHANISRSSTLKSIDKELNAVSDFIADPFAIELTRRAGLDLTTKDWKYDESIFVIALKMDLSGVITVEQGAENEANTFLSPETMTNVRISPTRNALRFIDLLSNSIQKSDFKFTSGVGNTTALCSPIIEPDYYYLADSFSSDTITEAELIDNVTGIIKPEILSFEYPVCKADFDDIRANPYGIITVDGEDCYIQEITRQPLTGMCEFKLIPKII